MTNTAQVKVSEVKVSEKVLAMYGEDYIVVGARFMVEEEFPTVELTTADGDNYYLQPFRGYRMQISGSIKGDGDYGSSDVVGLGNVMDLVKDSDTSESSYSIYSSWNGRNTAALQKEFFRLLVNQAFTNIGSTSRQWYVAMNKYEFNKVIDEFIVASMKYITDAME